MDTGPKGPFTVRFSFSEPVRGFTHAVETLRIRPAPDHNNPVFCEDIGRLEIGRPGVQPMTPQTDWRTEYDARLSGGAVRFSEWRQCSDAVSRFLSETCRSRRSPDGQWTRPGREAERTGRRMTEARRSSVSTGMRPWGRCGTTGKRGSGSGWRHCGEAAWSTSLRCVRSTRSARVRWRRRRDTCAAHGSSSTNLLLLRARAKRCRTRPRISWRIQVALSCDQRQIEFPQRRLEIPTQGLKKKSCSRPLRRPFPRSSFL